MKSTQKISTSHGLGSHIFFISFVKKETREVKKRGGIDTLLLFFSLLSYVHTKSSLKVFVSRSKEVVGRILREREEKRFVGFVCVIGSLLAFLLSPRSSSFTRCQHHHHRGVAKEGFDGLQNALKMVRIEIIVCLVCRVGKKESSDARR